MIKVMKVHDVFGQEVVIAEDEMQKVLSGFLNEGTRLYGMTVSEICLLRDGYMAKTGKIPITRETVMEAFGL